MSMRASSTAVVRIAGNDARGDVHVELEWVQAVRERQRPSGSVVLSLCTSRLPTKRRARPGGLLSVALPLLGVASSPPLRASSSCHARAHLAARRARARSWSTRHLYTCAHAPSPRSLA